MIGAIAGQQGFNTIGKTQGMVNVINNTTSLVDVVNISGSGYLMSANFACQAQILADIIIDGVTKISSAARLVEGQSACIAPIWKFNSSLVIKIKTSSTAEYACSAVSYVLD